MYDGIAYMFACVYTQVLLTCSSVNNQKIWSIVSILLPSLFYKSVYYVLLEKQKN